LVIACVPTAAPASTAPRTAPPGTPYGVGPFPSQPADVPWPTTEWTVGELPPEVDGASIDAAVEQAFNDGGAERVRAILIVHQGSLVYERYSPNPSDGPDVIGSSYSLSKSVLSAFIGILVRDELIDVHAPASVPEWHAEPDDRRAEITIEQMLQMASGISWIEDPEDPNSNLMEMLTYPDMAAYAASLDLVEPSGSVYQYSSGTAMVLSRILGEIVGPDPDEIRAFMDRELFDRLGMTSVVTHFDEAGTWQGAFSADATARDYARFGLMFLRGGAWDGEQIVPTAWVDSARVPSPANPEYGAHWWLDPTRPGVFLADGAFGQFIAVDPSHDVVVVQLGEDLAWSGERPLVEFILDAFAGTTQ
jgi:CubicO group peptidase (beta-lactamase class C family)